MAKTNLTDRFIASPLRVPETGRKDYQDTGVPGLSLRVTTAGHRSFVLVARFPMRPKHPTRRALGGAVTFYGGGVAEGRFGLPSLIEQAPALQTPWLGLYGDIDQGIPVADVEHLRAATAAVGVPTEIVRYPEADHGFNCNDRPAVFNPSAAADAWSRTLGWFEQHLGGA